jgi:hypothetical protein
MKGPVDAAYCMTSFLNAIGKTATDKHSKNFCGRTHEKVLMDRWDCLLMVEDSGLI